MSAPHQVFQEAPCWFYSVSWCLMVGTGGMEGVRELGVGEAEGKGCEMATTWGWKVMQEATERPEETGEVGQRETGA